MSLLGNLIAVRQLLPAYIAQILVIVNPNIYSDVWSKYLIILIVIVFVH